MAEKPIDSTLFEQIKINWPEYLNLINIMLSLNPDKRRSILPRNLDLEDELQR